MYAGCGFFSFIAVLTLSVSTLPIAAQETAGFRTFDYPAPSPDGRYVAFSSDVDGDHDVYLLDTQTGEIRLLTENDELDGSPVWTPDGRTIIYQAQIDGNREIFSYDLESGARQNLTQHPAEDSHPKVSADGRYIVFDSNRATPDRLGVNDFEANYEIYRMPVTGGAAERLTDYPGWDTYADLSPDGRYLTWRRIADHGNTNNSEIFWKDLETGEVRNLTNHPAFDGYPDFTPDGRILFSSNRAGQTRGDFDAYLLDPAGRSVVRVTFTGDDPAYPRVTRPRAYWDGEWAIGNRYSGDGNQLYRFPLPPADQPTGLRFRKVATSPVSRDGGLSRGVALADGNGDGWLDIYMGNTINQPDFLYWNRDGIHFEQLHDSPAIHDAGWTEGVTWVDVDNDGDPDLMAARTEDTSKLYLNDGNGNFSPAPESDIMTASTSDSAYCWADVNNDGLLDAVAATRDGADPVLYLNQGGGRLDRAIPNPFAGDGGNARTCAFGHANDDRIPDLAIGNFVRGIPDNVQKEEGLFYIGLGDGRFEKRTLPGFTDEGHASYGLSWADIDNDGDFDLTQTRIATSDAHPGVFLNGPDGFSESWRDIFSEIRHGPSKGHVWADFDNDGDQDLFIANGTEGIESTDDFTLRNLLFENRDGRLYPADGAGLGDEITISAGAAAGDIDNDGDMDLVVNNWGGSDEDNALYRNDGARGNWLMVALEGTESNAMGVGTIARATARIAGEDVTQTRALFLNTGYGSASDPRLHFGLAEAGTVRRLEILWPSGRTDVYEDIPANRIVTAREGEGLSPAAD